MDFASHHYVKYGDIENDETEKEEKEDEVERDNDETTHGPVGIKSKRKLGFCDIIKIIKYFVGSILTIADVASDCWLAYLY